MLKKFLFPICFFINCSEGMYSNSWVNVKYESTDYPMHKDIAGLVAKARYQGNPHAQENTSLIGITAYPGEEKSFFAHFGILSSKLDVDNSKVFCCILKHIYDTLKQIRGAALLRCKMCAISPSGFLAKTP